MLVDCLARLITYAEYGSFVNFNALVACFFVQSRHKRGLMGEDDDLSVLSEFNYAVCNERTAAGVQRGNWIIEDDT